MKIKYVKVENSFRLNHADKRGVYSVDSVTIYFSPTDYVFLLRKHQSKIIWKEVGKDLYILKEYADAYKIYYNNKPLRNADEWCAATGTIVMDPDGWDRQNFKKSWGEKISLEEFSVRTAKSTASSECRD